jgi:hypothetical protein
LYHPASSIPLLYQIFLTFSTSKQSDNIRVNNNHAGRKGHSFLPYRDAVLAYNTLGHLIPITHA